MFFLKKKLCSTKLLVLDFVLLLSCFLCPFFSYSDMLLIPSFIFQSVFHFSHSLNFHDDEAGKSSKTIQELNSGIK